jgi:hypothetical protein
MKKKARARNPARSNPVRQAPVCPECGFGEVVPIIQGIPTAAERKALNRGQAVLGDREEWEGLAEWYCKACGCDWSGEWRRYKRPRS